MRYCFAPSPEERQCDRARCYEGDNLLFTCHFRACRLSRCICSGATPRLTTSLSTCSLKAGCVGKAPFPTLLEAIAIQTSDSIRNIVLDSTPLSRDHGLQVQTPAVLIDRRMRPCFPSPVPPSHHPQSHGRDHVLVRRGGGQKSGIPTFFSQTIEDIGDNRGWGPQSEIRNRKSQMFPIRVHPCSSVAGFSGPRDPHSAPRVASLVKFPAQNAAKIPQVTGAYFSDSKGAQKKLEANTSHDHNEPIIAKTTHPDFADELLMVANRWNSRRTRRALAIVIW